MKKISYPVGDLTKQVGLTEKKVLFSIITCTLNSVKYLQLTIDSVSAQHCQDFEHIFIDGYSSDGTLEVIEAYQRGFPEKVSIYQLPSNGISNAMNYGIDMAKGSIILHLHGDDCLASPDVLQAAKESFDKNTISILIGNCYLMDGENSRSTWPKSKLFNILKKYFLISLMFYTNPIPHPSTFVKREVFQKYGGFDDLLKVVMDYDAWFRFFKGENFLLIDKVLSKYRFHPITISSTRVDLGLREIDMIRGKYKNEYYFNYLFFKLILKPVFRLNRLKNNISNKF